MPVNPTYPGIYIEELPSTTRTISAAPTSIAVFIGYTHPFKTKTTNWAKAVRIFSFSDYEKEFGGLYRNTYFPSDLAHAVSQFFLNGGSEAYVVAIQATGYRYLPGPTSATIKPPEKEITLSTGSGGLLRFEGLELIDADHVLKVTVANSTPGGTSPFQYADITVSYGSIVEVYRNVQFDSQDVLDQFASSKLVKATLSMGTAGGFDAVATTTLAYPTGSVPSAGWFVFNPSDFIFPSTSVFADGGELDKVDIFNLLLMPGVPGGISDSTNYPDLAGAGVWSEALAFCEKKRAFAILDCSPIASTDSTSNGYQKMETEVANVPPSTNGAIYFPYLNAIDPQTSKSIELSPSGYVAGIFARTDTNRGVWKAPAGLEAIVKNTTGVVDRGKMTDRQAGVLNGKGVNAIREFSNAGTVVFGSRTLVSPNTAFQQWSYVPVRRMALFIEQTLYRNLGWVIFEPNDKPLWDAIKSSIERFMMSLFRQGAFQGSKPSEAFIVQCDETTTTQDDIDNGKVNIVVGFAPLKPAEFVIVKIAQLAGQAQA